MKNEKLNAVTNKICELLKGTDLDPAIRHYGQSVGFASIREAEVLAALDKLNWGDAFIDMSGWLYYVTSNPHCENSVLIKLGQPLSSQPTEVIEFLFDVLNCE